MDFLGGNFKSLDKSTRKLFLYLIARCPEDIVIRQILMIKKYFLLFQQLRAVLRNIKWILMFSGERKI